MPVLRLLVGGGAGPGAFAVAAVADAVGTCLDMLAVARNRADLEQAEKAPKGRADLEQGPRQLTAVPPSDGVADAVRLQLLGGFAVR